VSDPIKGGYIMLYRSFQDSAFWEERRIFSRAEAWLDILMEARWREEPKEVQIKNITLLCHRGEVLYSTKTWAQRWGWSPSKVQRFLHALSDDRKIKTKRPRIVLKNEGVTVRITVSNYDLYQRSRSAGEAQVTRKRSADEAQVTPTEEGKNSEELKEGKESILSRADSESVRSHCGSYAADVLSIIELRPEFRCLVNVAERVAKTLNDHKGNPAAERNLDDFLLNMKVDLNPPATPTAIIGALKSYLNQPERKSNANTNRNQKRSSRKANDVGRASGEGLPEL